MNKHYVISWPIIIMLFISTCVLFSGGCKTPPAKTTSFISDTAGMMPVEEIKSYHKAWARNDVDWSRFKKIYVAPVSTKYLQKRTEWQKCSFAEYDPKGVENLAIFTRQAFISAHRANKNKNRLEVIMINKPDANTVILEMAITEVIPTKAWLNSISTAAIGWAPDKGMIALEARLRDGANGKIIAIFADREQGKESLFNVKSFTWYSHIKSIIEEWASQSVEITNAEEGTIISDSPAFEIKAW